MVEHFPPGQEDGGSNPSSCAGPVAQRKSSEADALAVGGSTPPRTFYACSSTVRATGLMISEAGGSTPLRRAIPRIPRLHCAPCRVLTGKDGPHGLTAGRRLRVCILVPDVPPDLSKGYHIL